MMNKALPILLILISGFIMGWVASAIMGKRSSRLVRDELYADSVATAALIADRDSIIAAYQRDLDSLEREVLQRDPVYIRVREAEDRLLPVGADSLLRILDSPVPDPRQSH